MRPKVKNKRKLLCASLSPRETRKIGRTFACKVLDCFFSGKHPRKQAIVIGLEGDLGGGKTTFTQGFAKGLGIEKKILSPTFVIMKKYPIPAVKSGYFYHIDCYRIESSKDLKSIGIKKLIKDPRNIIIIEWAKKIKEILPKNTIWIRFDFVDLKKRRIYSSWCGKN